MNDICIYFLQIVFSTSRSKPKGHPFYKRWPKNMNNKVTSSDLKANSYYAIGKNNFSSSDFNLYKTFETFFFLMLPH